MSQMFLVTEYSTNAPSPEEFTAKLKEVGLDVRQVKWHGGSRKYLVTVNEAAGFQSGVEFAAYMSKCSWHYMVEEFMPAE